MSKEKLDTIRLAIVEKKANRETIKAEFKDKEKDKALTTDQRLDRIERILGVN